MRLAILHESWITHSEISADEIAVLAVLALHSNKSGSCWPTQGLLARLLCRSRPWVNKVIGKLVDLGIVVRTHRTRDDGGDRACLYTLLAPLEQRQAETAVSEADTRSHRHDSVKDSPEHKKGTHTAHTTSNVNTAQQDLQTPELGWQPSGDDLCWAMDRHPGVDLSASVERFILRCRAKGYRYRDLGSAWRCWLADDQRAGGQVGTAKSGSVGVRGSAAQAKFDAWAKVATRAGSTRHVAT